MDETFLEKLKADFPEFRFRTGDKFAFRPPKTIILGPPEDDWNFLVLHELAHAVLGHKDFGMDIERVKMEAEAWEKAKELAKSYTINVDEEMIQAELDTYRDWLHKKSRCPNCGLTRSQTPDRQYHCPRCENF